MPSDGCVRVDRLAPELPVPSGVRPPSAPLPSVGVRSGAAVDSFEALVADPLEDFLPSATNSLAPALGSSPVPVIDRSEAKLAVERRPSPSAADPNSVAAT